jgi:membrane protease YdiL (CAAX protease family)
MRPPRSDPGELSGVLVRARREPLATMLCFVLIWLLLDRSAALLGSFRGEAGVAVCALVLAAAFECEHSLSRWPLREVAAVLGLKAPDLRALVWTLALVGALLLFYPAYSAATGTALTAIPNAAFLALGMFAQGGIAEEVLVRGFLFRRLRTGRPFWRAAWLAAIPFVAAHALLFLTLDFPLALASLLLSLSLSFPLAWLFELSGGSIWPPTIVHAVAQSSIKLVEPGEQFLGMAMVWMILSALVPWALFLLRR